MTREDANFILANIDRRVCDAELSEALDMAIKALSAEPCGDCVNRQAAIDTIENWLSCGAYNEAERHIMRAMLIELYDLPSITPKVAECEDAISRHDAIHLADELKDDLPDDERMADMVTAHNEGISEYQTKLSLLPPVTPKQETGHWEWLTEDRYRCSNCNHETRVDECMNKPLYDFCPFCGAKMEVEENG